MHLENKPVSPVITHVDRENFFVDAIMLSEIKFSLTAIGFYKARKLDVPRKLYMHISEGLADLHQFVCYNYIIASQYLGKFCTKIKLMQGLGFFSAVEEF